MYKKVTSNKNQITSKQLQHTKKRTKKHTHQRLGMQHTFRHVRAIPLAFLLTLALVAMSVVDIGFHAKMIIVDADGCVAEMTALVAYPGVFDLSAGE